MEIDELILDISSWIKKNPSEEDIALYVRSVGENNSVELLEASRSAFESFCTEKNIYYTTHNVQQLSTIFAPGKEVVFLSYAAEYEAHSVIRKYSQQYPALHQVTLPEGFSQWALQFCRTWMSFSLLTAYPEYLQEDLLLHSIDKLQLTPEKIKVLLDGLNNEVRAESLRYAQGANITTAEKEKVKQLLISLTFIPEAYLDSILQVGRLIEKKQLIYRLVNIFAIYEKSYEQSLEEKSQILLEQLRLIEEERMATRMGELTIEESDFPEYVTYLNKVMQSLWNINDILAGTTFTKLREYLTKMSAQNQQRFLRSLYASMRQATPLVVALDPINPDYVIDRVRLMSSEAELESFLTEMLDLVDEESQQELAKATIKLFYTIVHTYPEPQ